jgi:general nucleoside transport system permease protein
MAVRIRLERRSDPSLPLRLAVPIAAIVAGLLAGAVVMVVGGHDPLEAYQSMWEASLGSPDGIQSTAVKATPLILTGLAVAISLRIGLWNIGGEGQLVVGAVAATGVGLFLKGLPGPLMLALMVVAGLGAGAVWAAIAAVPRALFGLNEIIVTLFLNYIAILLMQDLIYGPWGDPAAFGFAYSRALPASVKLAQIPGTTVHVGIVAAVLTACVLWWLLERTRWGFAVRVTGGNPRAAQYLRLPIARRMVLVLAISGAVAGLAGVIELTGVTHRLQEGISVNYGYSGVLIAFLARQRPLPVVLAAVWFAALVVGSFALQTTGVAQPIATIVQALIIIFLLAGETILGYHVRLVRPAPGEQLRAAPGTIGVGR